jgi:hypothetical protein
MDSVDFRFLNDASVGHIACMEDSNDGEMYRTNSSFHHGLTLSLDMKRLGVSH